MEQYTTNFKKILKSNVTILYSNHFNKRRIERDLMDVDIEEALSNGLVIEHVARFEQGEKFLVHCNQKNKVFHIALVYNNDTLFIKTIYIPNDPNEIIKFKSDLKTRIERL